MAEETNWDVFKWAAGLGAGLAAFFAGYRRTRIGSTVDLLARLEQAERRIAEQERAMNDAITTVERVDRQVVAFERRLDREGVRQADHRNEVMEELRTCREALSAVVERLTMVLSQQRARQQDLGQAG